MEKIRHRDKIFKRNARKKQKAKEKDLEAWLAWWCHLEPYL